MNRWSGQNFTVYDQTTPANFQSLNLPLKVCVMMFFLIFHAYFCHSTRKDHIPQGMLDSLYTYNGSNLRLFVLTGVPLQMEGEQLYLRQTGIR